jgi:hypothetical protein
MALGGTKMDTSQITQILWAIVLGMFSGALANGLGYFKGTAIENFDRQKLFVTLFVGAVIGAVAGYFHMSYADALQFVVYIGGNMGSIYVIENVAKMAYRRISPYLPAKKVVDDKKVDTKPDDTVEDKADKKVDENEGKKQDKSSEVIVK